MDLNPFRNLEHQLERLERQFDEVLDVWDGDRVGMPRSSAEMGIDLADHGESYELTADVPGFDNDEIDVRVTDNTVNITAKHEAETREEDEGKYLKRERKRRSLHRSVRLPNHIDDTAVEATHQNGVLTMTLPKQDPSESTGTRIELQE